MKKRSIVVAAGLAAATVIGAIAPTGSASAGVTASVFVEVNVLAPNASATLDALTVEVWDIGVDPIVQVGSCGDTSPITTPDDLGSRSFVSCDLAGNGSYAIGVDGTPPGATATAECFTSILGERIPGTTAEFTIDEFGEYANCSIYVVQPTIFVDKVVEDGPSAGTPSDFTLEVYSGGDMVASGTDTVAGVCDGPLDSGNCAAITVPAGDLQLGETGPEGYVPSNVWCTTFRPNLPEPALEAFPAGIGEISLSDQAQGDTMAYCEITNRYYEGSLVVTKSVTNDDGGLLGPADFTAEIYTEPEGSLVTSAPCMADGSCLDVDLPIGDYRIGEADPQGYTPSVTCTVTGEPDGPGPITTDPPATTTTIILNEAIPGDDAVATVEPFGEVTCEIVNDDPTTTTTLAPTTTDQGGGGAVPTTVAPILPPTGDDNGTMAIIATLLIAIGGALLVARRRIA